MTQPKIKISLKDLEGKSQEELLLIAQQTQNLKKAAKYKKTEHYIKNAHDGQLRFHKSPKRVILVCAGNRGGKSTGGMLELYYRNTGTHPYKRCKIPIKSIVVLPDFENHGKNIFEPKLDEWIPPSAIRKIDRHQGGAIKKIHWTCGSTTDVYSQDQDLKSFEGSDYDLAWFDEPPPQKIWNAVWRGMTDRGGCMYLTGTPLNSPFIYELYQQLKDQDDPLHDLIEFDHDMNAKNIGEGNEQLGKERLEAFINALPEEEREARKKGIPMQLKGLVFKSWSRMTHMIEPFEWPHNWEIWESIDPHPHKPWAVTWTGIAENGCKILLQSALFPGVIEEVANSILMWRTRLNIKDRLTPRIVKCLIDNAASVPIWSKSNTDPTARRIAVREELENLIGPRVGGPRVTVAPKNVSQKIELFKRWLHVMDRGGRTRADFYVFDTEDNEDFCHEIENYSWARYKSRDRDELKDQPIKKLDDLLDSVMQVVLTLGESHLSQSDPIDMTGGWLNGRKQRTGFQTRTDVKEFFN